MNGAAEALWYTAPRRAELRAVHLEHVYAQALVRVSHSLISRGTERLVWEGRVPESEWDRMRAPLQEGDFPFPVKYGYASVGRVEAGPAALLGRTVFALAPHQTHLAVDPGWLVPVPDGIPARRACLAANMETALNAIWDAEIRPGMRVLVVGLGLVGCLIAALLSRRADLDVSATDVVAERAEQAREFSVRFVAAPGKIAECDLAFHTSATHAGLETALSSLAFEGSVIELSWYGDREVPVRLGGAFHARRLTLRSSQVGHVAPQRRASTSHAARLAEALSLLDDPRLDRLINEDVSFAELPAALERLLAPGAPGIATVVDYS